jgi:hypothetical protein
MAVTDIDISRIESDTRDFYDRTLEDQVHDRIPLVYKLKQGNRVVTRGGNNIRIPVIYAKNQQTQHYTKGQPMGSATEDKRTSAKFPWANTQTPIKYDVDDFTNNNGEEEIVDTIEAEVMGAQEGQADQLSDVFFRTSAALTGEPLGIMSALSYNTSLGGIAAYGGITRDADNDPVAFVNSGTAPVTWWGGWVYTTAVSPTLANFRLLCNACKTKRTKQGDYIAITTPKIFERYRSLLDARKELDESGDMVDAGFQSMKVDGIEIVLDDNCPANHFFMLNTTTWEWRINPKRNFKMTNFVWQGDMNDGVDEWLARIMIRHNLVCRKPIANGVFTNMSL